MPSNRPRQPMKRIKTPREMVGTEQGLLFQIDAQIVDREKELIRIRGDIAYLQRRKTHLQRVIQSKQKPALRKKK